MDFKKLIKDWEQLIDQYDRDANQIQKQMSEMLKSEWATNQTSLITVGKMKTIVARTERFSRKAESKLLRAIFKVDTLMCNIEDDLEEISSKQNPSKKPKTEAYIESDQSDEEDSDATEASDSGFSSSDNE